MKILTILVIMLMGLAANADQICIRNQSALLILNKQPATITPIETASLVGAVYARHGLTVQPVLGAGVRRGDFWQFRLNGVPPMKLDLGFNPVYPPNWMRDVTCTLPLE